MLILEHSYWLKFWSNQSECLKMSIAQFYAENISTGLGPVLHQIHGYAFQSHLPNRQIAFLEVIRFPNSGTKAKQNALLPTHILLLSMT